ncbi:uncharacterized protein N7482_004269 [Penicillium canariense]|uniref:DNA-binding protein RAP1 n=1 Tax=Penicillium canariense TaxID=189055 RepID=A0A9W9I6A2_9EURO|nr:uncharacterized protein N7482_004269 [Penicillium canariense]KAJ5168675.1 hypothetical protein N7482_004269 [Penicillium canariense]
MAEQGTVRDPSSLFKGARFFMSRAIPQRTQLKDKIEQHGGSVVLLEKDADVILVDHMKKNITHPANALSYQYVEQSIRRGRLEDPESHRVGASAPRPMGASNIPQKSTRRSYTLKDDQIVFDWLYPWEQEAGAPTHGNQIYQALAERGGFPRKKKLVYAPERPASAARSEPSQTLESTSQSPKPPTRTALGPRTDASKANPEPAPPQEHTRQAQSNSAAQTNEIPREMVDPLFIELPYFPSSPEPEDEDDDGDDDDDSSSEEYPNIDSWVATQVAGGADLSKVLDALRFTSMEPPLAKKLLEILLAGNPVPDDMRGVWTEEDDRCLEGGDSHGIERVLKKHGDRLFKARWEYLSLARERGLF